MIGDTEEMPVLLARIETKLDMALARSEDHEGRIRKLEKAVWLAAGFAAAGGGLIGTVVTQAVI
jgi:hypothetical protein